MRDLNSLSNEELVDFFNSFDHFLSDVDGVVWNLLEPIPGTKEAVQSLKALGKQVAFLTNNTVRTIDYLHEKFLKAGFDIEKDSLSTPVESMISYLQKQNLQNKKIFVIGMSVLKTALTDAGFQLAENGADRINETIIDLVQHTLSNDPNVGAIIVDVDVNMNYLNLQKAGVYLENPQVLFLCGPKDVRFPIGLGRNLIGPGIFIEILERMTKRKATPMAKLSPHLNDFVMEKFKITDPKRVLFVGDSIPEDMGVGTKFGYKKLLVLSGLSKRNAIENWTFPKEYKPDFYVDSLETVPELIERAFGGQVQAK